jgi:chaperonin GroES
MSCPIQPLGSRVVVKAHETTTVTKSGIIIPDTVSKEKPQQGEIIAVGLGKLNDEGKRIPLDLKVGDIVIFSKYSPTEFKIDDIEYLILDYDDVKAVVKK